MVRFWVFGLGNSVLDFPFLYFRSVKIRLIRVAKLCVLISKPSSQFACAWLIQ